MDSLTFSLLHLFPPGFCNQRAQRYLHPACALQTSWSQCCLSNYLFNKVNPAKYPFCDFFVTAWLIGNWFFLQKLNKLSPFVWLRPLVDRNCSLFFSDSSCCHRWEQRWGGMGSQAANSYRKPSSYESMSSSLCHLASSHTQILCFHEEYHYISVTYTPFNDTHQ